MDFFGQQAHVRRQTRLLIVLFGLASLVVIALFYVVVASLVWSCNHPIWPSSRWNPVQILETEFVLSFDALFRPVHFLKEIWDPPVAIWITLGMLLSIAAGCFYKFRLLSGGGPAVAEWLGGRCVETGTTDPDERRLRNVVEEMAIASCMPVPEVYVLDSERGLNSFAAGHTRDDVAIGITWGCLKLLTRDQLQGVIAHEFSHVLNGDTRLNMRLMTLAHGLIWPTILGRALLYGTDGDAVDPSSVFEDCDSAIRVVLLPVALPLYVAGCLGTPLVRLIKSTICRNRERLADASAVQFTRNPAGIVGALKTTGGLLKQGRLDTPFAETASHFYFANSTHDPWFVFQSTHPPLTERILAIDPQFDGQFPHIRSLPSHDPNLDGIYENTVRRAQADMKKWETET